MKVKDGVSVENVRQRLKKWTTFAAKTWKI